MVEAYYVEEPDIPSMAVMGLNGLTILDAAIRAENANGSVTLLKSDKPVTTFVVPSPNDVVRWGYLTATFLETARTNSQAIADVSPERLYKIIFQAAFSKLDRFSRYLTAKEARASRSHREGYTGIGIRLKSNPDGAVILSVFEDSPASDIGLRKGDRIELINGEPIKGNKLEDVILLLRGPSGSSVRIGILREGKSFQRTAVRRAVIEQTVFAFLRDGAAYLKITGFNEHTRRRLDERINELNQEAGGYLKGMILDLRGNRGGMLDVAVNVADLFIAKGPILTTAGRHRDARQEFDANAEDVGEDMPLVVLIDSASASASEVVAAALQDSGRGLLVGARSYGKGTVQRVRDLPNNGALNITWAEMRSPAGYTLARFGVFPNICTGDIDEPPHAILERLRSGKMIDPIMGPLRRLTTELDAAGQSRLLKRCGDGDHLDTAQDPDLFLALGLLGEPALFNRVFDQALLGMERVTKP